VDIAIQRRCVELFSRGGICRQSWHSHPDQHGVNITQPDSRSGNAGERVRIVRPDREYHVPWYSPATTITATQADRKSLNGLTIVTSYALGKSIDYNSSTN